ncbi:MAG: cell wall-binding repeat-containing protein [Coriobacteriia bacterium]|nr:cell wall-binding repeat-containing protein [Coriobacteriia bacterium]
MRSAGQARPPRLGALALALALALAAPPAPPRAAAAEEPRAVVVALASRAQRPAVEKRLRALGARDVRAVRDDLLLATAPAREAAAVARAARGLDAVAAAAPEGRVIALGVPPDDPAYADPERQPVSLGPSDAFPHSVNLEPAWGQAFLGLEYNLNPYRPGVKVAVVDSGVSPHWREDTGRVVDVRDYVEGDRVANDELGHGTVVASVIGAKTGNRFGIAGVVGDAPVTIEAYRVLDARGGGSTADVLGAIMDAADRGCKVINCSLGERLVDPATGREVPGLRALYDNAVAYARARGSVVVAAAGNSGDAVWMPAAASGALAIGWLDPSTGVRSPHSCWGPELDLVAPGQYVWGVGRDGRTLAYSGTSLATPIVSGTLALLWSLVPAAPAEGVVDAMLSTAVDYPPDAPDGIDPYYGHGRVDAWAAYRRLMDTVPVQAPVTLAASRPNGFWTTLSWTRAAGSGVFYRYGYLGGPESQTTATSAKLFLGGDGAQTVYVRAFASDRWASGEPATATVTVATGLPPLAVRRHAGPDRYGTSAEVSRASYPDPVPALVVASGADWPDALAASTLARAAGGPLLLTPRDSLPIVIRDEVVRLRPSRIYLVGGTPAVSSSVARRLEALVGSGRLTRLAGADRYATARAVAARVRAVTGSAPGAAVVASGEVFPDALSAAPYAARAGYPVLLTRKASLPAPTRTALSEAGVKRTVVVGGPAAVSNEVARLLPSPTRVGGKDRYETSRLFAAHAVRERVLAYEEIAVATGRTFPDALSGGPVLAGVRGPVVLADALDTPTRAWFDARKLQVRGLTFLGGPPAVSLAFEDSLKTRLRTP